MKVKVQAIVVYEWEEDSENWGDDNPETIEDLILLAQDYSDEDPSYILDCEPKTIGKIEVVTDE